MLVIIKPLKWVRERERLVADTIFGYLVIHTNDYKYWHQFGHLERTGKVEEHSFLTVGEAKAKCWKIYLKELSKAHKKPTKLNLQAALEACK